MSPLSLEYICCAIFQPGQLYFAGKYFLSIQSPSRLFSSLMACCCPSQLGTQLSTVFVNGSSVEPWKWCYAANEFGLAMTSKIIELTDKETESSDQWFKRDINLHFLSAAHPACKTPCISVFFKFSDFVEQYYTKGRNRLGTMTMETYAKDARVYMRLSVPYHRSLSPNQQHWKYFYSPTLSWWGTRPSQGYPQHEIRLYTWAERHCEKQVSFPRTQYKETLLGDFGIRDV